MEYEESNRYKLNIIVKQVCKEHKITARELSNIIGQGNGYITSVISPSSLKNWGELNEKIYMKLKTLIENTAQYGDIRKRAVKVNREKIKEKVKEELAKIIDDPSLDGLSEDEQLVVYAARIIIKRGLG